jgi:hypothetical protein
MRYLFFQESHVGAWQFRLHRRGKTGVGSGIVETALYSYFQPFTPDVNRGDFADLDLLHCTSDRIINHLDFIHG